MSAVDINSQYIITIDATSKLAPEFHLNVKAFKLSLQKAKAIFETVDNEIISFNVIDREKIKATLKLGHPKVENWTLGQFNNWFKNEIAPLLIKKTK